MTPREMEELAKAWEARNNLTPAQDSPSPSSKKLRTREGQLCRLEKLQW